MKHPNESNDPTCKLQQLLQNQVLVLGSCFRVEQCRCNHAKQLPH